MILVRSLALVAMCLASQAQGGDYRLLEPTNLSVEMEYYDTLRDPYIRQYDSSWTYGSAISTQITLLGRPAKKWKLFLDPKLRFRATESQIRQGGLNYETGLDISTDRGFRFLRRHESLHCLECNESKRNYPLLDSWVFQINWKLNK